MIKGYAIDADPRDARMIALARALAVRSYLIGLGMTTRIDVGAFTPQDAAGATDRVEILAPGR